MRRSLRVAALGVWLLALLRLTLGPGRATGELPWWSLGGGSLAAVDAVANLVLFAPAGWLVAQLGWRWQRMLLAAALLSAGIEVVQLALPGRTAILGDLLLNVLGATAGWLAGQPVKRSGRRAWAVRAGLLALLVLHVLDHRWSPESARFAPGSVWPAGSRVAIDAPCDLPGIDSAICFSAPVPSGTVASQVVRPSGAAAAGLTPLADLKWDGRRCYSVVYRTQLNALRFRPPRAVDCRSGEGGTATMILHPTLRRHRGNLDLEEPLWYWSSVPASHFLYPVWPFPGRIDYWLPAAGALCFFVVVALTVGRVGVRDALFYLFALAAAAGVGGFGAPGWYDLLVTVLALAVARLAVFLLYEPGARIQATSPEVRAPSAPFSGAAS